MAGATIIITAASPAVSVRSRLLPRSTETKPAAPAAVPGLHAQQRQQPGRKARKEVKAHARGQKALVVATTSILRRVATATTSPLHGAATATISPLHGAAIVTTSLPREAATAATSPLREAAAPVAAPQGAPVAVHAVGATAEAVAVRGVEASAEVAEAVHAAEASAEAVVVAAHAEAVADKPSS